MNTLLKPATIELMEDKGFTDNLIHDGMGTSHYNITIADAVMWLYEKHNIWVYVWNSDINMTFTLWLQLLNIRGSRPIKVPSLKIFHTPTEAYEAAITYVLNNLI